MGIQSCYTEVPLRFFGKGALPKSLVNHRGAGTGGLDFEHRRLIGMLETLSDEFEHSKASVSGWFGELYAETAAHFALEEGVMRRNGEAAYESHKADHERLLDQFRCIMEAYEAGQCHGCGLRLRVCLANWFSNHVRESEAPLHGHAV